MGWSDREGSASAACGGTGDGVAAAAAIMYSTVATAASGGGRQVVTAVARDKGQPAATARGRGACQGSAARRMNVKPAP